MKIEVADVTMIKVKQKTGGKWNLDIVDELCKGKDNVIGAVRMRAGKCYLERPTQLFCSNTEYNQSTRCTVNSIKHCLNKRRKWFSKV